MNLTVLPAALERLCSLRRLAIDANRLHGNASLPLGVLLAVPDLEHLSLGANPWLQYPTALFALPPTVRVHGASAARRSGTRQASPPRPHGGDRRAPRCRRACIVGRR